MKRVLVFAVVIALLGAFLAPATSFGAATAQADSGHTYKVTVGYENAATGVLIQAFLPDTVTIHVGDTVHWVQGSHEIHTVTFLAGAREPELIIPSLDPKAPSPLQFHPVAVLPATPEDGQWNGTYFVNSGLMSLDKGFRTSWDLTFTLPGTYSYFCLVHGVAMSGTVIVLPADQEVPSPAQTLVLAQKQLTAAMAGIPAAFKDAESMVSAPTANGDGTTSFHVMIGYSTPDGKIDLMRFFPSSLNVRQGDTVVWDYASPMGGMSMAPHTVSFFNGTPDQPLTLPATLYINPLVLFPSAMTNPAQAGQPLTRNGFYNSGLLMPPDGSFSIKIGAILGVIKYECILHDASGMNAQLVVRR